MNLKVSFKPVQKQILDIEEWLIKERDETGDGFYCNWNIITSAIEDRELATISSNRKAIGFIVWRIKECTATIDIMEIEREYRGKGVGRQLAQTLINLFSKKKISAIDLQCSPPDSEFFWRKMGFIDFPSEMDNAENNKWLYKTTAPGLDSSEKLREGEIIELWNAEPHHAIKSKATWIWNLRYKNEGSRMLISPLIHPASKDWRIRWTKNGHVLRDSKVKYFDNDIEILFGRFFILRKMPKLVN